MRGRPNENCCAKKFDEYIQFSWGKLDTNYGLLVSWLLRSPDDRVEVSLKFQRVSILRFRLRKIDFSHFFSRFLVSVSSTMVDILVQSTQPLLLPGEQSLNSLGSLLLKLFLIFVFFLAFLATYTLACIYRREFIEREQSNNQESELYIFSFRLSRIFSHFFVPQVFQTKMWNSWWWWSSIQHSNFARSPAS